MAEWGFPASKSYHTHVLPIDELYVTRPVEASVGIRMRPRGLQCS